MWSWLIRSKKKRKKEKKSEEHRDSSYKELPLPQGLR